MRYLLDTSTISIMLRDPTGPAVRRLDATARNTVGTSILVRGELRFGYVRRKADRFGQLVERFLATLQVVDWSDPCDRFYADIRADLERRGRPIGQMDMLIAAHARALGAAVVTDNVRDFSAVDGLAVENWMER